MAAQAIAINEVEWRNARVTASAGQVISTVAKVVRQPAAAVKHYAILRGLRTVTGAMSDLLNQIHSQNSIAALEAATPEQRSALGLKIRDAHDKIRMMITALRTVEVGYWRRFYTPKINALESSNRELGAHADALRDKDSSLILLSNRDQEFLLESLLNTKEPSEELRRVFTGN